MMGCVGIPDFLLWKALFYEMLFHAGLTLAVGGWHESYLWDAWQGVDTEPELSTCLFFRLLLLFSYSALSDSCDPWTIARQISSLWNFSGKNSGVGCHFLLGGIFPTQGMNPHLLQWQSDSLINTNVNKNCNTVIHFILSLYHCLQVVKGWCNHPHLSDKEIEVHEAEWPPEVVGPGDWDSGPRAASSTRKRTPEVGPWHLTLLLALAHLCHACSAIYLIFLLQNGSLFIHNRFFF